MESRGVSESAQDGADRSVEKVQERPLWREALMRRMGRLVLAVCPHRSLPQR